jgi:hypothetical protein
MYVFGGPAMRREGRGESMMRLGGGDGRECGRGRGDRTLVTTGPPEEDAGWRRTLATRSFDAEDGNGNTK